MERARLPLAVGAILRKSDPNRLPTVRRPHVAVTPSTARMGDKAKPLVLPMAGGFAVFVARAPCERRTASKSANFHWAVAIFTRDRDDPSCFSEKPMTWPQCSPSRWGLLLVDARFPHGRPTTAFVFHRGAPLFADLGRNSAAQFP